MSLNRFRRIYRSALNNSPRKVLLFCTAMMLMLAGCSGAETATPPIPKNSPSSPVSAPPPTPTGNSPTQSFLPKATGKLSARLAKLVETPALLSGSPEEQARALSLPEQGPGSLIRDAQGRLLVNIRLSDLSAAQLQSLQDAGCVGTTVHAEYHTITAYVAVDDLSNVSDLSAVQSIAEELTPATGGSSILTTTGTGAK